MSPVYDKKGREFMHGDLIKSYHFTGRRRRREYLYHVVRRNPGSLLSPPHLEGVPYYALLSSCDGRVKGSFMIRQRDAELMPEIIQCMGVDYLPDRPKVNL